MASNRVTLRQLAAHVGVHPSTASRALDPKKQSLLSPQVVQNVKQAAEQLGYYPNRFAHGLKTNQSSMIGVVVADVSNPTTPRILQSIQNVLKENGYTSVICSSDQRRERKHRIIEIVRKRQFDGVIMMATERRDPIVMACQEDSIPVVLLDKGSSPPSIPAVRLDERAGVSKLVEHLTSLGHKRIALISGPQRYSGAFARHRHIVRELVERGLQADPSLNAICNQYSVEEGIRCGEALIGSGKPFTAIMTANDLLAIGCLRALERHGICCPEQVSVVGYKDIGLSDKTSPPLTTIRFSDDEPGIALANILLSRLKEPNAPATYREVKPVLVVRGSTSMAPAPVDA